MHNRRTSGTLSAIGKYCDGILEAGWLAAVILTPVFYNIYSSRIFEPDKAALLRTLALVMLAAWAVKLMDQGGIRTGAHWKDWLRVPLLAPVAAYTGVYLLATALSVSPRISFWGSYQRLEGTYTTLAYIVIFLVTWPTLRTRAQLERLLNVIILTSLPVALYGVLQHYGLDPLPWGGDVVERVTGTLGNAIFIAAYLIMAFFITLERTVARFWRLLSHPDSSAADAFMGGAYLFILVLQLLAIYFSKSRGPWLGLLFLGLLLLGRGLLRLLPRLSAEPCGAGLGWRRVLLVAGLPAILTPLLLSVVPIGLLPLLLGDYLTLHFLLMGVLMAVGLQLAGRPVPLRMVLHWRPLLAAAVIAGFGILVLGLAIDRYVTSFVPATGTRLAMLPVVLAGLMPFFLSDEWLVRGASAPRGAYLVTKLLTLASLAVAVALRAEELFFLAIIVPVMIVFFVVYGLIGRWSWRATGQPLVAGLGNAVALAWGIAATFPIVLPP